ncbi:hypothetical protein J5834_01870 [bacterium]|nr:hypothetical protein [bacterium]
MKKILIAIAILLIAKSNLFAQLVVETPSLDAIVSSFLSNSIQQYGEERVFRVEQFVRFLTEIGNVVKAVDNTAKVTTDIMRAGSALKQDSGEWMKQVRSGLDGVFPDIGQISASAKGAEDFANALSGGKYADYISGWSSSLKDYHEKLLQSYGMHNAFPDIFSTADGISSKEGAGSTKKIVHKAWIESGLEQEMESDAVRKRLFGKYYEEYQKQAKANENIEAIGLANLMQLQYLSAETLEEIRRNLDLSVIEREFQGDFEKNFIKVIEEKRKERPKSGKKSIFSF